MNKPDQTPWISVIIVSHNDGNWLPRCLDSLRAQTICEHIEVIIVDNASSNGTDTLAQELIADWPQAKWMSTGGDNGFDVACNRGAGVARGRYLYLLNTDVWLEADCLEQLYWGVEKAQATAGSAIIYNYDDRTVQVIGCHAFDLFINPLSPANGRAPQRLFCFTGFPFIRRDVFLEIGLLDEQMFMYCEEVDLSWRIWLSGGKIVPINTASIHHRGAALVNPAGGTRAIEHRTSLQKRYLANRNGLITIAKNSQNLLLAGLLSNGCLVLAEFCVTLLMTRSWTTAKQTTVNALCDFWKMRQHIWEQRRLINRRRVHSDFWMLRFFRPGFGRWHEVRKIFRMGFPKMNKG